jgi:SAM-dependent methyltransferase
MGLKATIGKAIRTRADTFGYQVKGGTGGWMPLCVNPLLKFAGVELAPKNIGGGAYISCRSTITSAHRAGLTVPAYVAQIWEELGVVEQFVQYLRDLIPLSQCSKILEIGAGTGRFLEPISRLASPASYEVYETNSDWADYLVRTYNVTAHKADGRSLVQTPDASQNLVHAHCVFVYLPISVAFGYFHEMCRVCAPGGFIVFDCFLSDRQTLSSIERWRKNHDEWQMILPREPIIALFTQSGFETVAADYEMKTFRSGYSQYLIFRRHSEEYRPD